MSTRTYSNVEKFRDGSPRWLWQVLLDEQLYQAGVCMSLEAAVSTAAMILAALDGLIERPQVSARQPLCPPGMIDLDALDDLGEPGDDA